MSVVDNEGGFERDHLDMALELLPPEREAFLEVLLQEDPESAADLAVLLDEHPRLTSGGFLAGGAS